MLCLPRPEGVRLFELVQEGNRTRRSSEFRQTRRIEKGRGNQSDERGSEDLSLKKQTTSYRCMALEYPDFNFMKQIVIFDFTSFDSPALAWAEYSTSRVFSKTQPRVITKNHTHIVEATLL